MYTNPPPHTEPSPVLSPSVPSSPQPVYPSVLYAQAPSQHPIHGQTKASFDSSTSPAYHATQYVVGMSIISSDPRAPDPAGFPRFLTAGELLLAPRFVSCMVLAFYTVRSQFPPSYPPLLLHLPQLPNPSNPPKQPQPIPPNKEKPQHSRSIRFKNIPHNRHRKAPKKPIHPNILPPFFLVLFAGWHAEEPAAGGVVVRFGG